MGLNYYLKNKALFQLETKKKRERKLMSLTGFSLLELIMVVAILSIGIIAVLQALSFSARVTGLSCDIIKAVFLTQDKIQELELKEKQNLIKEESIKDTKDKFSLGYTLNLDPDLNLYKLNFCISWQRANRQESLNINTYLRQ